ncbi:MAG: heme o synthase [Immundisolibacteraceae bacterium]|nr:heme o synthase [Immundisolibacteraceae bacterium]
MTDSVEQQHHPLPRWRSFLALCKPRVVALICFTAIIGMYMAVPGAVPGHILLWGNLGIFLAAASAATINQVVDAKADAIMNRTQSRPLPQGEIPPWQALVFAGVLGGSAMLMLTFLVNPLTAALTFGSLIGYAFVYTMYLKRATPQNIVIGGIAGAAPPALGWVAVTGQLDPEALLLVIIIFIWTPPHFWALAIARREEYSLAAVPMLPVTHGVEFTRLHILLYTILLLLVTMLPFVFGLSGGFYLIGALALGGRFFWWVIKLYRGGDDLVAMATFRYSIIYLMLLFAVMLIDHYL